MVKIATIYKNDPFHEDQEKAAYYFFLSALKGNATSKKNFQHLVKEKKVEWKKEYLLFWPSNNNLKTSISVLLLISKYRKDSAVPQVTFVVKGIILKIIRYLCHFSQNELKSSLKIDLKSNSSSSKEHKKCILF